MRYILIILTSLLLTSCGSYSIVTRQPEISHVMAITTEGDTIRVPIQEFQRKITPDYYNGWNIYWNNSWWMYNDWYWNYWYTNPRWFQPRYFIQTPRPRVSTPPYIRPNTPPRINAPIRRGNTTPQVQPNRGRSNQQPKSPQYNRPARTQTTPNVIQRPTQTRSNVGRGNNGKVKQ